MKNRTQKETKLLLLASSSPRRKTLLKKLGISFKVVPSTGKELSAQAATYLTPSELVAYNAFHKALNVSRRFPQHNVLAADTVVALENRVFEKPRHLKEAADFLKKLSGKTHQVLTGVTWIDSRGKMKNFVEISEVTFHPLSKELIQKYLKEVEVLDKAGAYALQERGKSLISEIKGLRSNVIGLPIERLSFLKAPKR